MNLLHRKTKMQSGPAAITLATIFVTLIAAAAVPSHAQLPAPIPLYGFQQESTDVISPQGPIAQGRDGNLYGVGTNRGANGKGGVWKITPAGAESLLVSFPATYGGGSCMGLVLGMDGNFYGTCSGGGVNNSGLFYRVTPAGVLSDLYDFEPGDLVQGVPVLGEDGDFYGTTSGTVYRITTAGAYKLLLTFAQGVAANDANPSVLTAGADGNFYGAVADASGFGNQGGIYRITSAGGFKLLTGFTCTSAVGCSPSIGLTVGTNGKLYGTTSGGGANDDGFIFSMTTAGKDATALHVNNYSTEGGNGTGGGGQDSLNVILQGSDGNFYGANSGGGSGNQGGLYQLTPTAAFSGFLFLSATNETVGDSPYSPLMQHTNGTIFGTTNGNGENEAAGVFFSLNAGAPAFISLVTPVYAGKEETQVGILGQGFSSGSVVEFGGTATPTRTLTGSTFIMATVPPDALTGKVTVTTGAGTLSTLKIYKITPTVTAITPTSGPVGTPVTITGTGLAQATKVTFDRIATAFTVISDEKITTTVPAGAGTGKFAITTKGGSASSKTFTVN